ncbi:hypothetical protein DFJ65_1364 [Calidifontibacter indicus]|uniref:Secreted protein n=1 Tax=Calidifontibacter indicus TaxID=419650 RepID=A0A3D9ULN7_9MICO|nr:hypothetical protein DFJ65_1364 [Calidifontibacter indicus]
MKRRTVAKGMGWAAPVVALASAAPPAAASLRKDPGINGWVLNSPTSLGSCKYTLKVDSTVNGNGPDGAPFGLYLYDVQSSAVISNAVLTYWIIGNQTATWATNSGHSTCWSGPVRGTPATKADGLVYTPYVFTYTCPINPASVSADGRLRLGGFNVTATFTQPDNLCNNVTYWTQRSITIDQDGVGSQPAADLTFERRNGTLGPYTGSRAPQARSASGSDSVGTAGTAVSAAAS